MLVVLACFCVFVALFTLAAVIDARDPARLTRRYRHLDGATVSPYVVARRARAPLDAPGSALPGGIHLRNA